MARAGCYVLVLGGLSVLLVAYLLDSVAVLVLGTLSVYLSAFLLNSPIPDGFSEPWKLSLTMAPLRLISLLSPTVDRIYGKPGVLFRMLESCTPVSGVTTRELIFDGVRVRLFVPEGGASSHAGIIFIHGGGWVLGSVDDDSEVCANLSISTGMTVLAIEYRLAPEHVYPAAFQDCLAATQYFLKHAAEFGVDPERIAIAGDSAGGELSAAVALYLRDHKVSPALKAQVLLYPALQPLDFNLPSHLEEEIILSKNEMIDFWLWYAIGDITFNAILQNNRHTPKEIIGKYSKYLNAENLPRDVVPNYANRVSPTDTHDARVWEKLNAIFLDPYFSPGIADDLTNLPATFIMTAGTDPLRDEAILFALRLKSAGNDVTHNHYKTAFHGIYNFSEFKEGMQIREDVRNFIIKNL